MLRLATALTVAALAPAQAVTLQVTARAGGVERSNSPAAATFAWPPALAAALGEADAGRIHLPDGVPVAWNATLKDSEAGAAVPCEVLAVPATAGAPAAGMLRFIVARLPAGAEKRYRLELGTAGGAPTPFATASGDDLRELRRDGATVVRHTTAFDRDDFERTNKPIWHLLLPGSDVLLTKGPGGEYSHHRGLFLGWNKTQVGNTSFDFWHCPGPAQRHAGYDLAREITSAVRGEVASATHWLSPHDEPLVRDRRTLTVWQPATGPARGHTPTLVDVAIELSADQTVALRGDPQHAGFQLRVADEVAQRKDARYVRPGSAKGKDDVWSDCPWVAGLFEIEGRSVAIVHMSHPDNPQPTSYSTRDYGRFGAFFTADITPGSPLRLRYRLAILEVGDGDDVSAERFARDYADFATPIAVEVVMSATSAGGAKG